MYIQNKELVTQALALLLSQFKDTIRVKALIASYVQQLQELENAAWDLYRSRFIDEATFAQLDLLGALVGQPRNGQEDLTYRKYIKLRIFINKASGLSDEVLYVLQAVMPGAADIMLTSTPPASFTLSFTTADLDLLDVLVDLIDSTKAAGVGSSLVYSDASDATLFACSDTGTLTTGDTLKGLADDAQTTGGHLTGVI